MRLTGILLIAVHCIIIIIIIIIINCRDFKQERSQDCVVATSAHNLKPDKYSWKKTWMCTATRVKLYSEYAFFRTLAHIDEVILVKVEST